MSTIISGPYETADAAERSAWKHVEATGEVVSIDYGVHHYGRPAGYFILEGVVTDEDLEKEEA